MSPEECPFGVTLAREMGNLEARVRSLYEGMERIEKATDHIIENLESRVRTVERDVHAAKKVGGLAGAAIGGLVSAIAAIWSALSR